jgi:hypothetical protein
VNVSWVIRLARQDASSLAGLRLIPNVEVGEDDTTIWLRVKTADESLAPKLAGLPARERYEWLPSNALRAMDARIPSAQLPNVHWRPIAEWLKVEAPTAALPGILNLQPSTFNLQRLTLVRSSVELEPELLLTSIEEFNRFAETAAQVRLDRLQFAANAEGSVLVRGRPLPPLSGKRFVLHGPVAVPAGYSWQPAVSAEVLASSFGVSGDTLILWSADGTFTRLYGEQFVPASRSAIRATLAAYERP